MKAKTLHLVAVFLLTVNCILSNFSLAQTTIYTSNVYGTWTLAGSPYLISGNIEIPNDSTLVIQPGVTVKFQNNNYTMKVFGRLLAIGTITDTIIFTDLNTTNGWEGISFINTTANNDTSKFIYCKLQYGRPTGIPNNGTICFINFSKAIVSHCRISNCTGLAGSGVAIACNGSSNTIISYNRISNNTASYGGGIYCQGASPTITNNIISYNSAANKGGAIYCASTSNYLSKPIISNNIISNNSGSHGAGICIDASKNAFIFDNTISNNTSSFYGGGIYCSGDSSKINNNVILNNTSVHAGGGIYFSGDSSTITNNTISNNSVTNSLASGGGIYYYFGKSTIANNTIAFNTATGSGGGINCDNGKPIIKYNTISNNSCGSSSYGGGGIYCFSTCTPTITYNTISNNSATGNGGGVYCSGSLPISYNSISNNTALSGAGLYCSGNPVSYNIISNNTASSDGGGLYYSGSSYISYNTVSNNTASSGGGLYCYGSLGNSNINNNTITNNSAASSTAGGGGIFFYSNSPIVTNNTISNNLSGKYGGAIFCFGNSDPTFRNTIFRGNTASAGASQVYLENNNSDPNFYYCDVDSGIAAFGLNGGTYTGIYSNNLNIDPLFVAPSGGSGTAFNGVTADWSLQIISPCIDKGDNNISIVYPAKDKADSLRVTVCRVDIGAYEYQTGKPLAATVAQTPSLCFGSPSGTATVTVSGGNPAYSYLWSSNGQTTSTATGLSAAIYNVTVTEASGCTKSATVAITQPQTVVASMNITNSTSCSANDGSISSSVSGGTQPYSYVWSNSATTSAISGLAQGTYTLTVTDFNGCTKTFTATVSCPNSVSQQSSKNEFTISPNPFSFQTTLQTTVFLNNATLTVYNSLGKAVKQIDNLAGPTAIFQRDNLPSGLYFVRLTQEGKPFSVNKLVIADR